MKLLEIAQLLTTLESQLGSNGYGGQDYDEIVCVEENVRLKVKNSTRTLNVPFVRMKG